MERKKFTAAVLVIAVTGCAGAKLFARTVDDAATIACHQQLAAQAQAQGVSVEDVCRAKQVLQPFIDAILSTSQSLNAKYGARLPTGD